MAFYDETQVTDTFSAGVTLTERSFVQCTKGTVQIVPNPGVAPASINANDGSVLQAYKGLPYPAGTVIHWKRLGSIPSTITILPVG